MDKSKYIFFPVLALALVFSSFLFLDDPDAYARKRKPKIKYSMTLSLGLETVDGQEKVKVYGVISPAKNRVRVSLTKRVGKKKKFKKLGTVRTDSNGVYYYYMNQDSNVKAIQAKAKPGSKKLTKKTNFNLSSITEIVGESSDSGLSTCGSQSEFFSSYPINPDNTTGIAPLGNVNPSGGHVFPTDHIYFFITKSNPADPGSAPIEVPLYAPGNVTITSIDVSEHQSEVPVYSDYSIKFAPCSNVSFQFGHVTSISSTLQALLTPPYVNESTYTTGGKTYHTYSKLVSTTISAGEQIGTAGGRVGQNALDFFGYDYRNTDLSFANASRWTSNSNTVHTACPLDYYTTDPKAVLRAKLGESDGSAHRTTEPICGRIDQDVSGTAKGAWFAPGSPNNPEDPHLSLIDYNANPAKQVFSVGTSMSASSLSSGSYMIPTPADAGNINLHFENVNTGTGIVCYEPYSNDSRVADTIFLLQLTSATTLRMEKQTAANCSGPYAFGANYTDFER